MNTMKRYKFVLCKLVSNMYPKTNTWFADCWRKESVLAIRKLGITKTTYAIW